MNEPIKITPTSRIQIKNWVTSLTAILIVLPAMINAGFDVYKSLLNIPVTDSERTNVVLFEKYFGKQPISQSALEVKNGSNKIDVKFAIYEEGDVFVEYGNVTQWFPLPKTAPHAIASFSLLSSAFAANDNAPSGVGSYTQTDRREGDILVRVRVYENGVTETLRIDPRTGQIIDRKTESR